MGKGRAPCCDKNQVKRGPWSPAEDLRLMTFIQKHGHDNWRALPKRAGLLRCGKSCRLRWINYLRPDVKRGNFTQEEEQIIIKLHESYGNKWSKIASQLPGRTDNEIKNVWNTHLKKKILLKNKNPNGEESKESSTTSSSSTSDSSFKAQRNRVDKHIEIELTNQVDQTPRTTLHNQICQRDELKEPSSCSSYNSSISNLTQLNVPRQDEETSQEFSYSPVDIPLESDLDFWGMLETLDFPSMEAQENSGEEFSRDVESRKWLRYLENELGLDATRDENQELPTKTSYHEVVNDTSDGMFKSEIEPLMAHLDMCPVSPYNFTM